MHPKIDRLIHDPAIPYFEVGGVIDDDLIKRWRDSIAGPRGKARYLAEKFAKHDLFETVERTLPGGDVESADIALAEFYKGKRTLDQHKPGVLNVKLDLLHYHLDGSQLMLMLQDQDIKIIRVIYTNRGLVYWHEVRMTDDGGVVFLESSDPANEQPVISQNSMNLNLLAEVVRVAESKKITIAETN